MVLTVPLEQYFVVEVTQHVSAGGYTDSSAPSLMKLKGCGGAQHSRAIRRS